jgi:hypothetical protein
MVTVSLAHFIKNLDSVLARSSKKDISRSWERVSQVVIPHSR